MPDVTGHGDPSSGYTVLVDGSSTVVGGTSAVAPLWAALITRMDRKGRGTCRFINPQLYSSPGAFNDVKMEITARGRGQPRLRRYRWLGCLQWDGKSEWECRAGSTEKVIEVS